MRISLVLRQQGPKRPPLRSVGRDNALRTTWENNVRGSFDAVKLNDKSWRVMMEDKYYVQKRFTPVAEAFPLLDKSRWQGLSHEKLKKKEQTLIEQPENPHVVRAVLIGSPNAGKSTLMNALVGSRVSAESQKAGVTAKWVKGVTNVHNTQIILLDTPGVFHTKTKTEQLQYMNHSFKSWDAIASADVVCYLHQAKIGFVDREEKAVMREVCKRAAARRLPVCMVMTKMDTVKNASRSADMYAALRADITSTGISFSQTFETSAFGSTGLVDLKDYLARFAKPKKWEHKASAATSLTPPEQVLELVRQSMFSLMPDRTPYGCRLDVMGWTQEDKSLEVAMELMFESLAHFKVFLTHQHDIREAATQEIQRELKKKVRLVFFPFVAEKSFSRQ